MSSGLFLEEKDIFGALFCGRKLFELKNEEFKFWLRCRGDSGKGFKIKVVFVERYDIDYCYYCYFISYLEDFFEVNIYSIFLLG